MPILIRKMHEFCIEADVTLEEWMAACNLLAGAGQVTTPDRHEVVLCSDVFGIESLVGECRLTIQKNMSAWICDANLYFLLA